MPYGQENESCQNRMVELGSTRLDDGHPLVELRRRIIAARASLAEAGWPGDPTLPLDKAALDRALLRRQAEITRGNQDDSREGNPDDFRGRHDPHIRAGDARCVDGTGLNSKYAEKARIQAAQAIVEQCSRARRIFAGRVTHLDEKSEDGRPTSLPPALLTPLAEHLAGLKRELEAPGGLDKLLDEARQAVASLGGAAFLALNNGEREAACSALPARAAALAWLFGHVTIRFGRPAMDAPDRDGVVGSVVQIHLDKDCLRPVKRAYPELLDRLSRAAPQVLREGKAARFDLSITPVVRDGKPIPFSIGLGPRALLHILLAEARLDRQSGADAAAVMAGAAEGLRFRSLCLEIGPDTARMAAVVARAEPANSEMVRTATGSERKSRRALDAATLRVANGDGSEKARKRLEKAQGAHGRATVRLAQQRAALEAALASCRSAIGVDPGKRDAIAAVPLRVPEGGTPTVDRVLALGAFGREEMRDYLSSHALPDPERAGPCMVHGNAPFLALAQSVAAEIDAVNRRIDAGYRRVRRLKERLAAIIGRSPSGRFPRDARELPTAHLSHPAVETALATHWAI